MIYPEKSAIALYVLRSVLFGAAMGMLHPLIFSVLGFLRELFYAPRTVARALRGGVGIRDLSSRRSSLLPMARVTRHIADLVFVLLFGIGVILLLYVCTDGVFRVYILSLAVIPAVLTNKLLGRRLANLISRFLGLLCLVAEVALYIPAKAVFVILCRKINRCDTLDKEKKSC